MSHFLPKMLGSNHSTRKNKKQKKQNMWIVFPFLPWSHQRFLWRLIHHETGREYTGKKTRRPVMGICHKKEICFVVNQGDFQIISLQHNFAYPIQYNNALKDSC